MPLPTDQERYQVRFEWGRPGLDRLAPADVVVLVDVLTVPAAVSSASPDAGAGLVEAARTTGALVLAGSLRNASAVADVVVQEQTRRQARTSVAVVAVGEPGADGQLARVTVEDLLGAGAIIDALTQRGIDHSSPEAVVAAEAFSGLRGALRHLLTASGSGQALIEGGQRDVVIAAAQLDAEDSASV